MCIENRQILEPGTEVSPEWQLAKAILLNSEVALVVIKNGQEITRSTGKGILPLLRVVFNMSSKELSGAILADKVIGRAAGFLAVKAGFVSVYSPLMSEPAKDLLEEHGITAHYEKLVPNILRQDKTGLCPMEQMVFDIDDCEEAYTRLINFFVKKGISLVWG